MNKLEKRLKKDMERTDFNPDNIFLCIHEGEYPICKQCDTYGRLNSGTDCEHYETKSKSK